ncbi:hypothetical protein [Sorangium sp. So ce362]|uniref:hypothetical protein n=1 Tax=Sorangium sp. So ce362 TaxID=3133303 RepID=UPI003F5D8939
MSDETASAQHDGRRGPSGRGSSGGSGVKKRDGSARRTRRLRGPERRRTNKGRYRVVWVSLWGDEKFRRLTGDAKLLWLYLLTGPVVTTLPGLFAAGRAQLAEALSWPVERFDGAFAELAEARMATADWDARVVCLPNACRHNPPANPNMVLSYRAYWDEIPECPLKFAGLDAIVAHLMTCPEGFREAFARAFADVPLRLPERFANGSANGSPNQDQEQDQDQDQDQEKDHSRAQRARAPAQERGVDDQGGEEGEEESAPAPGLSPAAEAILAELQARPELREVAEPDFAAALGKAVDGGTQTLDRALGAIREGAVKQAARRRPPQKLKDFLAGCVLAGPIGRPGPDAAELPEGTPAEAAQVLEIYAEAWSRRYGAYCEDPDGADRATAGRVAAKAHRMAADAPGAPPEKAWLELVGYWAKRFLREEEHAPRRHRLDMIHGHLQRYRTPWHERADRERLAKTRPAEEHHAGPRSAGAPLARRAGGEVPPPPELRQLLKRMEGAASGEERAKADASAA